ncbi:MAG: aldehyde dehydrogenase (NAD+), partial [Oceanospirillaceae bacterium]
MIQLQDSMHLSSTHFAHLYIDGQWQKPHSEQKLEAVNPATQEVFASFPDADAQDVEAAVLAAKGAFKSWSTT